MCLSIKRFSAEKADRGGAKKGKKRGKSKKQGAGKIIPRALVLGFNWAFHRGTRNRPLSHLGGGF